MKLTYCSAVVEHLKGKTIPTDSHGLRIPRMERRDSKHDKIAT